MGRAGVVRGRRCIRELGDEFVYTRGQRKVPFLPEQPPAFSSDSRPFALCHASCLKNPPAPERSTERAELRWIAGRCS